MKRWLTPFKGERVKKWKGEKMANATNVFGFASFIPYSFPPFHLFKVDKFVAKHLFTLSLFHLFTFPLEIIRKHRVVVRQHDWRLCGHL